MPTFPLALHYHPILSAKDYAKTEATTSRNVRFNRKIISEIAKYFVDNI